MKFIGGLFTLGVHGFFAGILLIAVVFWWHGRDLPSTRQLAEYEPATLSRVYSGDGALLAEFARERRLYTPIEEIPPLIRNAFISAEDKNFYAHEGVDGLGVLKAMVDNLNRIAAGRRLRGASTITQQVVKNFLLSGQKAVSRKVREALLAWRLESALSKEEILELYLNEIFLGQNAYGVTTAALRYFGKRLEDLNPEEAAYLAALPKAPSDYHPVRQRERAVIRRDYVLKEMRENGHISLVEYEEAVAAPLATRFDQSAEDLALRRERTRVGKPPPPLDYFAEEIRRTLIEQMGEETVYQGGLVVRATLDPDLQALAEKTLQDRLTDYARENGYVGPVRRLRDVDPEDADAFRAAVEAIDAPIPVDGWRLAAVRLVGQRSAEIVIKGVESDEPIYLPFSDVQGWAKPRQGLDGQGYLRLGDDPKTPADVWSVGDVLYVEKTEEGGWSMRQVPEANGGIVAMDARTGRVLAIQGGFSFKSSQFNRATQAKRQPGSAFKPFVYAAALENGYRPNSIILDAPVTMPQREGEVWKPKNYSGRFYGPSPLRLGIEKSQNLMTVRVALDVGLDTIGGYAERFGVYETMPELVSYALGAGETTLLKLTASYAMFVNGGKLIQPTLIDRIQDRSGKTIFRHDQRICLECAADDWSGETEPYVPDEGVQVLDPVTAYQLVSMLEGVTIRGTASRLGKALPFPVAGKTGTTNDARDAWFIGFTPDLVVGCYIGFDTPRSLGKKQSGGSLCAPVFETFMAAAIGDKPSPPFRTPTDVVVAKVDRETGCVVPSQAEGAQYIEEAFRDGDAPQIGACPAGGIGGPLGGGLGGALGGGLDQQIYGQSGLGSGGLGQGAVIGEGGVAVPQGPDPYARRPWETGPSPNGGVAPVGAAVGAPAGGAQSGRPRRPAPNIGLGSGGIY